MFKNKAKEYLFRKEKDLWVFPENINEFYVIHYKGQPRVSVEALVVV